MAFAIPRIQYKNLDTTGDTLNTNATISNIPDTTLIEVGMFIRGAGIPTGATVGSKTSSTVVLASGTASATASGVALAFGYEILFTYPPKEAKGEKLKSNASVSTSLSGIRQTSVDNIEGTRNPIFSFLTQALKTKLDTFVQTSALFGEAFRYFEDQTSASYVAYELDALDYDPKKIAPAGVDVYTWEIALKFVRTL